MNTQKLFAFLFPLLLYMPLCASKSIVNPSAGRDLYILSVPKTVSCEPIEIYYVNLDQAKQLLSNHDALSKSDPKACRLSPLSHLNTTNSNSSHNLNTLLTDDTSNTHLSPSPKLLTSKSSRPTSKKQIRSSDLINHSYPNLHTSQPVNDEVGFRHLSALSLFTPIFKKKEFKCQDCPIVFKTSEDLESHTLYHIEPMCFFCTTCKKICLSQKRFEEHLRKHGDQNYVCGFCNRKFDRIRLLRDHIRIHIAEKPFLCHMCYKRFKGKNELSLHIKKNHNRISLKRSGTLPNCFSQRSLK